MGVSARSSSHQQTINMLCIQFPDGEQNSLHRQKSHPQHMQNVTLSVAAPLTDRHCTIMSFTNASLVLALTGWMCAVRRPSGVASTCRLHLCTGHFTACLNKLKMRQPTKLLGTAKISRFGLKGNPNVMECLFTCHRSGYALAKEYSTNAKSFFLNSLSNL